MDSESWPNAFASGAGWSIANTDEVEWSPVASDERYERRRLIGSGGMGRVYAAWDARLEREVALKEVAASVTGATSARLGAEARITAQLEHPAIVPVHDAGESADGRLFYTMRLVRGRSLLACITEGEDPMGALLRHFLTAAQAIAFAHSKGVVHRDLKPENIMVGEFGEVQVVDWGLARMLDDADGQVVGTPAYMAPEQAEGQSSPSSDVWSLGATLHHLLGRRPPFSGDHHTIFARARAGQMNPLDDSLPPDIRAVAMRALSLDPAERYPSAAEFAADLARFLDGRRVAAYSYSPWELARRLVLAWRVPIAVAAVGLIVTTVVGVGAWRQTLQERDRAIAAEEETGRALATADKHLTDALETQALSADREGRRPAAEVLAAHALNRRESADMRGLLAAAGTGERPQLVSSHRLPDCAGRSISPDASQLLCIQPTTVALLPLDGGPPIWELDAEVSSAVFVGDRIATIGADIQLRVLDRATGAVRLTVDDFPGPNGLRSNGRFVAQGNGAFVGVVDLEDGSVVHSSPCTSPVRGVALGPTNQLATLCVEGEVWVGPVGAPPRRVPSPFNSDQATAGLILFDGPDTLLLGNSEGVVSVVDLAAGTSTPPQQVAEEELRGLVALPDASRVAVLDASGRTKLVNLRTGALRGHLPGPLLGIRSLSGGRLLTLNGDSLQRWRLPKRSLPRSIRVSVGLSNAVISPDRRWLAAGSGDGLLRVYSAGDGSLVAEDRVGDGVIKCAAFSPDGERLMAVSVATTTMHILGVPSWQQLPSERSATMRRAGELRDGTQWSVNWGRSIWTRLRGEGPWSPVPVGATSHDGANSADGRVAAVIDGKGRVWLIDPAAEELRRVLFEQPGAIAVTPDSHGDRILLSFHDGMRLFDAHGALLRFIPVPGPSVGDLAISPDDRWIAGAQVDGTVRVWALDDGREVAVLKGHEGRASSVQFAANGSELISAGWGGQILRWSVDAFDQPATALLAEVERAWGMSLEDAL